MRHELPESATEQYRREGYYFPVNVLAESEVSAYRSELEAVESGQGGALRPEQRNKAHLLFKWVDDIIRDPRVLDPIEELIGPNILCWNTIFWIKEPGSASWVSWHQDIRYWGLTGGEVVSAWLALSPATIESGCMRVLPRSHIGEPMAHDDRYDPSNMLSRGQEITDPIDEKRAVTMPLEPGQMSLHSVGLAHSSGTNRSAGRRIGVSMHFMPTCTSQSLAEWDSAALVRGVDDYGHFRHTPRLCRNYDPEVEAFHARAAGATRDIVYHGADRMTERL